MKLASYELDQIWNLSSLMVCLIIPSWGFGGPEDDQAGNVGSLITWCHSCWPSWLIGSLSKTGVGGIGEGKTTSLPSGGPNMEFPSHRRSWQWCLV